MDYKNLGIKKKVHLKSYVSSSPYICGSGVLILCELNGNRTEGRPEVLPAVVLTHKTKNHIYWAFKFQAVHLYIYIYKINFNTLSTFWGFYIGTTQPQIHIQVRNPRSSKPGCRTGEAFGQRYQQHGEKPENLFTEKGSQLNWETPKSHRRAFLSPYIQQWSPR